MAVTYNGTPLTDQFTAASHGTGVWTVPGAFTPSDNSLLVAIAWGLTADGAQSWDASQFQMQDDQTAYTWTTIGSTAASAFWELGIQARYAYVTTGEEIQLEVFGGASNNMYMLGALVLEVTGGFHASAPVAGFVQDNDVGVDGAVSLALAASPTADDIVLNAYLPVYDFDTGSGTYTADPLSGYTALTNATHSDQLTGKYAGVRSSSTSTAAGLDDLQTGTMVLGGSVGIGFIVKAAAGGGGNNILPHMLQYHGYMRGH